jgi:hypothetical protein
MFFFGSLRMDLLILMRGVILALIQACRSFWRSTYRSYPKAMQKRLIEASLTLACRANLDKDKKAVSSKFWIMKREIPFWVFVREEYWDLIFSSMVFISQEKQNSFSS